MKPGISSAVGIGPTPSPELLRAMGGSGFEPIEINVGSGYRPIDGAAFPGHLDLKAIVCDGGNETRELATRHGSTISALPRWSICSPPI